MRDWSCHSSSYLFSYIIHSEVWDSSLLYSGNKASVSGRLLLNDLKELHLAPAKSAVALQEGMLVITMMVIKLCLAKGSFQWGKDIVAADEVLICLLISQNPCCILTVGSSDWMVFMPTHSSHFMSSPWDVYTCLVFVNEEIGQFWCIVILLILCLLLETFIQWGIQDPTHVGKESVEKKKDTTFYWLPFSVKY